MAPSVENHSTLRSNERYYYRSNEDKPKTNYVKKSFSNYWGRVWNSLPKSCKVQTTLGSFKPELGDFLNLYPNILDDF